MFVEVSFVLLSAKTALGVDRYHHFHHRYHAKAGHFDYFKLTLIYPAARCRADNDALPNSCEVPKHASPWTIHGLWPSNHDGSDPEYCDGRGAKFNLSQLARIQKKLEQNWPNLFPNESVSSLWKHEWMKHGTCAGDVVAVNGEIQYFNKTLALHDQLDIFGALKSHGLTPSMSKTYKALDVRKALQSVYQKNVEFHCLRDKTENEWFLADVRMCLSKDFQLVDCERKRRSRSRSRSPRRAKQRPSYQTCPAEGILYIGAACHSTAIAIACRIMTVLLSLHNLHWAFST
ncbi:unnamed protein product [Gongylonema pulchrum]|uniref:Ribonuclease T(2) n=1 Tax=Gongylonema pulchrum TaxID=637853 RepID=A0A183ESA8_9BILA|nr:unnamed protein product [Gongylonema pulchrum]